jgi:glycerol kinase
MIFSFKPLKVSVLELIAASVKTFVVSWKDAAEIAAKWKVDQVFNPNLAQVDVEKGIQGWKKAIQMTNI